MTSGLGLNDLGLFDYCVEQEKLSYVLVIVRTKSNEHSSQKREIKFGLCAPN